MAIFAAVLDACVMVPVSLCDTLLRLAEARMYRPIWSERILAETHMAIAEVHPQLRREQVDRRIRYMEESFPGARTDGFEMLEEALVLPDPDDRHVLAAAIRSRADAIVTSNLKDFPEATLRRFDIEAIHPEQFLLSQLDMAGRTVIEVLDAQAAAARNPRLSRDDVLTSLVRAGVPRFVDEVRRRG